MLVRFHFSEVHSQVFKGQRAFQLNTRVGFCLNTRKAALTCGQAAWPRWVAWCVWLTRVCASSSGTNNLRLGNSHHLFSVLMAPFCFGIPESCCPCFIRLVPPVYRTQLGSGTLSPFLKQTPDTLPLLCRSVPFLRHPVTCFHQQLEQCICPFSAFFVGLRQPAAGHPCIVGADIHTLLDGMSPGQKPRLPQRWLESS